MQQFLHTETRYQVFRENAQVGDEPIYVQYFPNRYSSFGLSQILLNQPKVASAAAYRLGELMIQFWLSGREPDTTRGSQSITNTIQEIGLSVDALAEQMIEGTYSLQDEQMIENQFMDLMNEINQLRAERTEGQGVQRRLAFDVSAFKTFCDNVINGAQNLFNELKNQFDAKLQEHGYTPGDHLKILQENKRNLQDRLEKQLENRVVDMLSNSAEYGIAFAQKYIEDLTANTKGLIGDILNETGSSNEFDLAINLNTPGEDAFQRYKTLLQRAQNLPSIAPFSIYAKRRAVNHYKERLESAHQNYFFDNLNSLQNLLERKQNEFKQYIRTRYRYEGLKRLANVEETGVLNDLIAYLNAEATAQRIDTGVSVSITGIDQSVNMFQDNLEEFRKYFEDTANAYQNIVDSIRNFNIALDIDYLAEIQEQLRATTRTNQLSDGLTRLSNRFFANAGLIEVEDLNTFDETRINALTEGVRTIYRRSAQKAQRAADWMEVRSALEDFVVSRMKDFRADDSALQYFRQSFQANQTAMMNELENRVRMGAIRIQPPTARLTQFRGVHQLAILGLNPPNDPIANDIADLLPGEDNNSYSTAGAQSHANDSILFFVELVAFPGFYAGGLRQLYNAYETNIAANPNNVFYRHTEKDYKKYQDILPPADDVDARSRLECNILVMQSLLLGTVCYDKGNFCIPYIERTLRKTRPLSKSLLESIRTLSRDENCKVALQKANGEIFRRWRQEGDIDIHYQYLRLLQYLAEEVYPAPDTDDTAKLFSPTGAKRLFMNSKVAEELHREYLEEIEQMTGQTEDEISEELSQLDLNAFSQEIEYTDAEMKNRFASKQSSEQAKIRVFKGGLDKNDLPKL